MKSEVQFEQNLKVFMMCKCKKINQFFVCPENFSDILAITMK